MGPSSDTVAGQSSEPRGSHTTGQVQDGQLLTWRRLESYPCGEGVLANEEWRGFLD